MSDDSSENIPKRIAHILRNLLDGSSPNGAAPDDLGSWAPIIQSLYDAHGQHGTESVRRAFNALAITYPELIQLVSSEEPEHPGGELAEHWHLRIMADAYQEREPWGYVVDGLIQIPSLCIVYGAPGSLKSMILSDLCACIAGGLKWLEPLPGDRGRDAVTLGVTQYPVLWIDFDNGGRRTDERVAAFGRAYDLPADAAIHYISMPQPWLDASDLPLITGLAKLIAYIKARVVIIDNLGVITGDVEENSAGMSRVLGNLRWLSEETQSAVIVIHHQRKSGGSGMDGVRKGETLRGHSSIEASLDLALLIERKEGEDDIAIIPTKVRGYRQYQSIGAMYTYTHREGTYDLHTSRFWGVGPQTKENRELADICGTIEEILKDTQMLTEQLINAVRDDMASRPGGKAPGINRIRGLITRMVEHGELESVNQEGKKILSISRKKQAVEW